MAKDIVDPVEALRQNTAQPFEQARAMPPSVYTSPEFMAQELEHIFSKDWYCVGRADALAKSGDYTTAELAGQPILVIRDGDGNLRAMSNVCLHRMSTLLHGRGNAISGYFPDQPFAVQAPGGGAGDDLYHPRASVQSSALRWPL